MAPLQKALILEQKFGPLVLKDIEIPRATPGKLVVRIEATALNPADWKMQALGMMVPMYPFVLGADASGTVAEVGGGVEGYAVGDRVLLQGFWDDMTDPTVFRGTFQQYLSIPVANVSKYPSRMSFEEAATVPSGLVTAAFGLYNEGHADSSAGLTPPWEEGGRGKYAGKPIFILGGATSIGQYVIQLARMSGFSPIVVTASLHNAELLESLGATHVLDRKLPGEALSEQARKIASGYFDIVYDAVSESETLGVGYSALAPTGHFVVVLSNPIPSAEEGSQKKVRKAFGLINTAINRTVARSLLSKLPQLLESGEIKPNRPKVLSGGLLGIPAGLERLRNNQVSGVKLVVKPQETQ
ncbi:GroES-like protein [Pilatotrama ljubarskyi]|nr:GroES-like protein [Pilatotrama ljubarskyi]